MEASVLDEELMAWCSPYVSRTMNPAEFIMQSWDVYICLRFSGGEREVLADSVEVVHVRG